MPQVTAVPAEHSINRLAVIDDAEFDQMLYKRLIQRTNLVGETLTFLSAEDALAYFERPDAEPVDVILLDINMPGMNGFDFLEAIHGDTTRRYVKMVVVMLTTSLNPRDVKRAQAFDMVKDYIHKPLEQKHIEDIAELLQSLRG